ncbi:hypothetical protein NZD89_17925 [Alicyclobacillus fastidiosus]|uniref:GlcNAc-PI de-N-acetylase n=1 Tax=Alicyclobacillus fastidiosus TaxID=392011 RepID=A0ABY6ZBK6_9BACL|nr:hypothetical protein [Alicyclobacillus fastidiosus]WAH40242.1 hypothetical protein NZD89_17925 [Alicyclobacillus fastidiosus]GMA61607.1 hypothetical protein GCM10025859_20470 [Alicyclobacillus fastidiosus]
MSKQILLNFPDAQAYSEYHIFFELMKHFRLEKPDIVFTVDPWMACEAHPDHIKTGYAVAKAVLFSNNPMLIPDFPPYAVRQIGFYHTNYPNTYMDITEHCEQKIASIFAHKSQFAHSEVQMIETYLRHLPVRIIAQFDNCYCIGHRRDERWESVYEFGLRVSIIYNKGTNAAVLYISTTQITS